MYIDTFLPWEAIPYRHSQMVTYYLHHVYTEQLVSVSYIGSLLNHLRTNVSTYMYPCNKAEVPHAHNYDQYVMFPKNDYLLPHPYLRARIPERAFFPSLGLLVSWLLAVAHSHNLLYMYIIRAWPVRSLTLHGAASFHEEIYKYIHITNKGFYRLLF